MNIHIDLKPILKDLLDVEYRVTRLREIRDWIDELVEWDTSLYEIKYHSSGQKMIVWFEHEEHAMLFKIRWQ